LLDDTLGSAAVTDVEQTARHTAKLSSSLIIA